MGQKCNGMTLLELLIVIVLVLGLMALAIPKTQHFMTVLKVRMVSQRIQHLIAAARMMAIGGNQKVIICPSDNGEQCGGHWWQGILVMPAKGNVENKHYYPFSSQAIRIHYRGFPHSHQITVKPYGLLSQQNGTFSIESIHQSPPVKVRLIMSRTGRIRKG